MRLLFFLFFALPLPTPGRSDEVEGGLASIRSQLGSVQGGYRSKIENQLGKLEAKVTKHAGNIKWGGVQKSIQSAATQIPLIMNAAKSGNKKALTTAVVSMVGSLSGMAPPPAGPIVGSVMSIFAGFLGSGGQSMPQVIQSIVDAAVEEVKEALDAQTEELKDFITDSRLRTLQGQLEGAARSLSHAHVMLRPFMGEDITVEQGDRLMKFANPKIGVEFMGELSKIVQSEAVNQVTGTTARLILNLLAGYVKLHAMRELMLLATVGILSNNDDFEKTLLSYRYVINEEKGELKKLFKFFSTEGPELHKWYLWLSFDPENYDGDKVLDDLGKNLGIPIIPFVSLVDTPAEVRLSCSVENGTNYLGMELLPVGFPATSPAECCSRCFNTSGCKYWSHSANRNLCFPKIGKGNVKTERMSHFTSGTRPERKQRPSGFRIDQVRGSGPWNVFFAKSYKDHDKHHFNVFPTHPSDRNGATSYEFPLMRTISGKIPSSAAANELTFYSEPCPGQHNAFKIFAKHNNHKYYWKRADGVYIGDPGQKYKFIDAVTSCTDISCCFRVFQLKELDVSMIQSLATEAEMESFLSKSGRAFWNTMRPSWIGGGLNIVKRHALFRFTFV